MLRQAMLALLIATPMQARVAMWREDYPHFAADPVGMVGKLQPLKPLVGKETLSRWEALASHRSIDALFEDIMVAHYDPCYDRSTRRTYGLLEAEETIVLPALSAESLANTARALTAAHGDG